MKQSDLFQEQSNIGLHCLLRPVVRLLMEQSDLFQEQSDIGLHCLLRPVCQVPDVAV